MKGRGLLLRGAATLLGSALFVGACADHTDDRSGLLTLPAEQVEPTDEPPALDAAAVTSTISASTTSTPPADTALETTVATATPTVVETLPQPAAPPEPRANEPYLELGTFEIPALSLSIPLLEGVSLTTLDRGPGHWPGTALPGHRGNVVVAGHRTSHGKIFRHIDELVPGDEVIFTTAEGRFVYAVTETTVVTPDAMYIIEQTDARTATLFACHPPGSTKQRIVVHLALQTEV
jgi:sortase A